ncbi:MAG: site-specific integrase [Bacilli bacterium]|jgi:site-specific recombinase XerD|nr:site-specific integrase [Bacilli bacterium]
MKLNKSFDLYLIEQKLYNSPGTYKFYLSIKKTLINTFGNIDSSALTKEFVTNYIFSERERGISPNTLNHRVGFIKRACRFSDVHPGVENIRNMRIPFVTFGYLDQKQQTEFFSNVFPKLTLRNKVLIMIFIDTGARLSEVINIRIEDINFDERYVYLVHTKTKHERYVYYTVGTSRLLKQYVKKQKKISKFLFSTPSGKQLTVNNVECIFGRMRKRFKIEKLSPHMLRHTLTTNLYSNGADLIMISRVLGHTSVETTKRYFHTDLIETRKRYDKFIHKKK